MCFVAFNAYIYQPAVEFKTFFFYIEDTLKRNLQPRCQLNATTSMSLYSQWQRQRADVS